MSKGAKVAVLIISSFVLLFIAQIIVMATKLPIAWVAVLGVFFIYRSLFPKNKQEKDGSGVVKRGDEIKLKK